MLNYYLSSTRRKNTDQSQKTGNTIIFQNFYKGEEMSPFLYSMFWDSIAIWPRNRVFFNEWNLPRKLLSESLDFQFLFLGTKSYCIKLDCPDTRNKSKLFREMEILVPWGAPGTFTACLNDSAIGPQPFFNSKERSNWNSARYWSFWSIKWSLKRSMAQSAAWGDCSAKVFKEVRLL